ncbi:MAG: YeeE/YedE family protein [Spirochaetaceae bacterium]
MIEAITGPWPWWVSGPLLGLMVPMLLLLANKQFGVSSSLRHICAAVLPVRKAKYFDYDWKASSWNIALVAGVVAGAAIAVLFLNGDASPDVSNSARELFASWGLSAPEALQPAEIFGGSSLGSAATWIILIGGGFLVGFGARYANGCTSGHAIMGLSLLSVGSLVAVVGFFIGGLTMAHLILPYILSLL